MGSLSEDELQAMEGKARKLTILDLKKRALAAKQGGDIETAKDEERMNPDIDASVGDVANHGEQSQKPYKSKTRTIIEHEEDLRRRFGSTLIAANMGHL